MLGGGFGAAGVENIANGEVVEEVWCKDDEKKVPDDGDDDVEGVYDGLAGVECC